MNKFFLSLGILLCLMNTISCKCDIKKTIITNQHKETFLPNVIERCRDLSLGPYNTLKTFILVFDDPNPIVNCPLDNIYVYDEMGAMIFDYCEKKQGLSGILFLQHVTKHMIVEYIYGGLRDQIMSSSFQWSVTEFIPPTTATIATPRTQPTFQVQTVPPTSSSFSPVSGCGQPAIPMTQSGLRVVGGGPVNPNSHPWQAYVTDYRGSLTCGGSLINNGWVLTAAHCVTGNSYKVHLGAHDLSRPETGVRQTIMISRVVRHQQYDMTGRLEHDIALLKLETPVTFTAQISPICLLTRKPSPNTPAMATGWGLTNDYGSVSRVLNQVSLFIRDNTFCRSIGMFQTGSTQICAGNTLSSNGAIKDSCRGDSGGPLIVKESDNRYYLSGVVSYGGQSCNGIGVYTNVASYLDWIDRTMKTY